MKIRMFLQYLFDKGGIEIMNKALQDNRKGKENPKPTGNVALDEVYIVMTEDQAKSYIPEFTSDAYREWFRDRQRSNWKDEWIDSELFED